MNKYIGNELSLFEHAINWKKYYSQILNKYISGEVVEVGAGLGGTTTFLQNEKCKSWICLEPDNDLSKIIEEKINKGIVPNLTTVVNGTIENIEETKDTIIYIDVIEHIENDKLELELAMNLLNKNGNLLIIVPAYNFLFNNFDKAIGHFRRYDKTMIKNIVPKNSTIEKIVYLDSLGFFTSLLNKFILKQDSPNIKQIKLWDSVLIPISKILDKLFNYSFGKSLLIIIKKG
jgi:hypothetical protein